MNKHILAAILVALSLASAARAQSAEAMLTLNEAFFDEFLSALFQNFEPPEFALKGEKSSGCSESIRVLREINGVRTAVRFREGRIVVPLAFDGRYSAPFLGCMEFSGWADSSIELEFDRDGQRLVGRVRVSSVNLSNTSGFGGATIARMLQSSIDRKLNPIEILKLEKLSFGVPIENRGTILLRATSVRPEVRNGEVRLNIVYQFLKGN